MYAALGTFCRSASLRRSVSLYFTEKKIVIANAASIILLQGFFSVIAQLGFCHELYRHMSMYLGHNGDLGLSKSHRWTRLEAGNSIKELFYYFLAAEKLRAAGRLVSGDPRSLLNLILPPLGCVREDKWSVHRKHLLVLVMHGRVVKGDGLIIKRDCDLWHGISNRRAPLSALCACFQCYWKLCMCFQWKLQFSV